MGPSADLGLPGIGRQARTNVPYKRDARDADGDGLLQEGTIWERNVGSRIHAADGGEMAEGAPATALAGQRYTVRNAAGERVDYKPGMDPKSPLRRGRAGGQRVARRGRRQHYQADRDVEVGREDRELVSEEDAQLRMLENAIAVESFNRWMEAEEQRRGLMGDDQRDWLDGLMEGWSGVRQGMKKKKKGSAARRKANKVSRGVIVSEAERRFRRTRAGIENEEEDWEDEAIFDDKILPAGVDRDEHNERMRTDPEYRAEFIRSMMDMEAKENRDKEYVHPPGYVSQPGDEDYEWKPPEEPWKPGDPGGMPDFMPKKPWDERDPDPGWEVDEDGKIVEKRTPRNMRIPDLTDEELEAEIKDLEKRSRRAKQRDEKLSPHYRRRLISARKEKAERATNAKKIADAKKAAEDAADAAAAEEARAKLEKIMMILASRFKNNPELMSYDEKKRYLDSLDRLELEEIYKDLTGFDAAKSWSRTGPKTPNLVDKIIKSQEPPPKVIDPDELDDEEYAKYLAKLNAGDLYRQGSKHDVKDRTRKAKEGRESFIKEVVAARKERREISDIANMDAEAITAERNALLKGKNPDDLTKEQLARIAVLDDALKDGVEDSLEAYMEYLKETKGKLRNDLKKRLKAKPDEAAKPKKKPEPAGPVDDSGKPIPPPPDLKPADVVPEDVVPEEALEELAPDLVGPRVTHDPGGTFTWAAGRPFENLTNDELDYEIRRQLSYEAAGGPHDLAKHSALNEEWLTRNPDSDEDVDPLGDETPTERATAIREFQEAMRSEVADDWKEVAEGLEVLREELDSDVLPDFKFWSEEDDPFGEREELFGKYYHVSGELNDRGVLLNEQIVGKDEDDEPEIAEDEAEIVERIEEIDDAVEEIVDTARDRREPAAQPVPDDPRFVPTLEEGDIRISENMVIHTSNTDDDVRPMLLVQMPDGTVQAFYRRTGSGNRGDEAERIEAGGGGGKGNWVPFDGFGGRMGKNWFRKGESNPAPNDGPLYRYGTEELKAAGQALDASENVQAMLDDPDRQVHIVHSDPSKIGGELMLDPDDPTIQRTSEELNEILGLPSTEEYIASLVEPEDVDVPEDVPEPKITLEDAPEFTVKEAKEGDEWRAHARSENGRLIAERRNAEDPSRDGFFSLTKQAYGENVYAIGKHQPDWKNKPYSGAAAWSKEKGEWTFFLNGDEPWSGAEAPEADEVSPGAVVPEPEAATPKPKVEQPPVPEVRMPKWDRLNDGTEYRVVAHNRSTDKTQDPYAGQLIIERRGGKGQDGFYRVKPSGREGEYEAVGLIKNFDEDKRDDFAGKRFFSVDDPWPDGTPEEVPEVEEVAEVTAPDFWTDLPEGLSAEDVNQLMIDKRQERVDAGKLPNVDDESLDDEIRAEIIAERTDAPEAAKPKPEVVSKPPETPASLAETDEMEFYFGGPLPSALTSGDFDETLESLRARKVMGLTKSEKEQHRNRLALFETHQTLSTGNPTEVVAAMNALLRHDEKLGDDPPEWEKQVILTRMDEAIRALEGRGREGTEPPEVTQRRELLEKRMEKRDTAFVAEVAGEDVVQYETGDADEPEDVPEFDLTREELERLLQADRVTGKKKDEIVAILLDMTDDLDPEDLEKMTVKQLKELIKEEKDKSRATLLKLVEDERDKGRTLGVDERSSNVQIIEALLDTSEDDDDDAERLMPGAARLDADQGDAEVVEPAPIPVSDPTKIPAPPTRLVVLRAEVVYLAELEARKKIKPKKPNAHTPKEREDYKRLRNSHGPGGEGKDELAEEEAAYKRTLDRSGFVIDDDTKKITKKPGPSVEERARAVQVGKEVEKRRAVEAQVRADAKKSRLRRIWDKLKEMSPADRRLAKLNRETETEKKERLARVKALRAKGETRTDGENVELRDLERVEAAAKKDPRSAGAAATVERVRKKIDMLVWGEGEGSSLVGMSNEDLVERGSGEENPLHHGNFAVLMDRPDSDKDVKKGIGRRWRMKLTEEEGKEEGEKKRMRDAEEAMKKAAEAARKVEGTTDEDVYTAARAARNAVLEQPIVPETDRPLKRQEIKEIFGELEDALVHQLLVEWDLSADETVIPESKWAEDFGMSSMGTPVLITRTGPKVGRKNRVPARYFDLENLDDGTEDRYRRLGDVTLEDGEKDDVNAVLTRLGLETLPDQPGVNWGEEVNEERRIELQELKDAFDAAGAEGAEVEFSEDDEAELEKLTGAALMSRYYLKTDDGFYLNDRGVRVNNELRDPVEVEKEAEREAKKVVKAVTKVNKEIDKSQQKLWVRALKAERTALLQKKRDDLTKEQLARINLLNEILEAGEEDLKELTEEDWEEILKNLSKEERKEMDKLEKERQDPEEKVREAVDAIRDPNLAERELLSEEIEPVSAWHGKLTLEDVERFVKTGKRGPESEERPEIVQHLRDLKGKGGPTSALKRTETEDGVVTADIDQMIRVLFDDPDAGNPFELDDRDPPLAGAADERSSEDPELGPKWGNVARRGAKDVDKGNRKAKTVRAAIEEAARRKREEADSLPPSAPVAEDNPDKRLQEMIRVRDSRVSKALPRLDEFPEFDDGTEDDPVKRVVKHSTAVKKEADVLRAKKEAFDADAASPYSEEEEERLEKLEEYEAALADARNAILAVKGRLRTLTATGRDDPPLSGSRPWNWDDRDREERRIFEAEFNETMAGMTLEQVEAIADGRVVWEGPDPFNDQRETIRVLRRLARIEARKRREAADREAEADADLSMLEPEPPMSRDDRLRKILTDMGVSEEMADDPLFREFAMLTDVTGRAEKDPRGDDPLSEETIQLLKGWVGPDAEAKMDAAIAEGIVGGRSGYGIEWIGLARLSGNFDWEEFSRSRGYTDREIQDYARWLEVTDEIDEKYPEGGTSPHPETGEPVPWASTSQGFIYELGVAQKTWIDGAPKESTGLADMWTEDLDADWKRAHGMHVGEWSNPNDEKYGRRTLDNTLVQGPGWPPGLNPQEVGELSLEELQVLGTEILKAIRFNTLEDEGIEVDENERAAHLRHSLHTLNNQLLEDVLLGVYKRLEREGDGFDRGSDDPGYPPIRPRSDEQVVWDRMAEDMETWTEEQWDEAADEAAEAMVEAFRGWLEENDVEVEAPPEVPDDPEYAETVAMHRELVRSMSSDALRELVDEYMSKPFATQEIEKDGYLNVLNELEERERAREQHQADRPPEHDDVRTAITEDDGEFRVRLFINGRYQAGADYFTDDREEAEETAKAMEADAHISDKTTDFAQDEAADFDQMEIDGRSIPLSLDWADDPEVQRLHDAMYPPEKALYYGNTRSDLLEEARQHDPNSQEGIVYEVMASTVVEAEFMTDAQIDEQIRRLADVPETDQISGLLRGVVPSLLAQPMSDDPNVVGRVAGLQTARLINFSLKEQFAKREMRLRAKDMSVEELESLIQRLESHRDTGMVEMEFNGIVLFGDDDKYLLDRRIEALYEIGNFIQSMDPLGETYWGPEEGVVLPRGVERLEGPYPFILTDEGDLEYVPNLTGPTDALDADFDASISNLLRDAGPTAIADALVDMLKRLKAHQGELDPDMYRESRRRHLEQLEEALNEMDPEEQEEYLAGLGNFFQEIGLSTRREGDGLDLSGHDLPDKNWANTDFESIGADPIEGFKEANFHGSNLSRGDFRGVDLRGADFTGTRLDDADFTGADLRGANFDEADITGADFTDAVVDGVNWGSNDPDLDPPFTDPPLMGGVPRGPNSAGRGQFEVDEDYGLPILRQFDPDADYTFEDLEKWPVLELREAARELGVHFGGKSKKELIEDILARRIGRYARPAGWGRSSTRNEEPSLVQQLGMLRIQYRNAETVGDQDEMDRIADELRALGGKPFTRRRRPDRGRRIDRGDPPLTGAAGRRGVERTNVDEAMERYDSLGLEELNLDEFPSSHSPQRLRDLRAAREELYDIHDDPTLPRDLRNQAGKDVRDLTDAINAEERIRGRAAQEAWNVQYADTAQELFDRATDAFSSGGTEDLGQNWEDDVEEVISGWSGSHLSRDDRPELLQRLESLKKEIDNYKTAAATYDGVHSMAKEIIAKLALFPEEEGAVPNESLGVLVRELEGIEQELSDMPYTGVGAGGSWLQENRDHLLQKVRESLREAMYREQELDLGPLGDIERWTGDDLDGSTALLSVGTRPRPMGLGIAGDVVDGFVRAKRVPVGHKGLTTKHEASRHVRSGGDISDVPDEFLTHALLTNSSRHRGERFLRMSAPGDGYVFVLRQRINQSDDDSGEPDVYGQEGFVVKTTSAEGETVAIAEWAASEVLHHLGYPVLPARISAPTGVATRGEPTYFINYQTWNRGATVVVEFAWNSHPLGEELSPAHETDGFDVSDFDRIPRTNAMLTRLKDENEFIGLEGRLMNWLARTLLSDLDGHSGNAISARSPKGMGGVVPIDLEGGFDPTNADQLLGGDDLATLLRRIFYGRDGRAASTAYGGLSMDRNWRMDLLAAIGKSNDPEVEQRFETIIRTAIERFKMMLGDPNWVDRLGSAGPYSSLVNSESLLRWSTTFEQYVAVILPKLEDVDGIVDAILGRAIVDETVEVQAEDLLPPSSEKMLAVVDYINTCLESTA